MPDPKPLDILLTTRPSYTHTLLFKKTYTPMKVAISADGNTAQAHVDSRFGRCACFAIYDTETRQLDFIKNTAKDAEEGAGPAAVGLVANQGVSKIVSGEFGFKIKSMLTDLNIQMVMMKESKTIAEIVDLLNH